MPEIRVAAIVQARMGSSRFPGKVLKPLAGKPVLWHIIHRLKKCGTVTDVAVATSVNSTDDPLVEFCAREDIPCIRGSEKNVLDRYRQAAQALDADVIVRVTGDAPLVDPGIIDRLVKALIEQDADYAAGDPQTTTIHEGFSPFSRRALERLVAEASGENSAREHVTAYIKEHPESFRTVHISMPEEHRFEGARLSVDTPADLRFLEEVYSWLGVPAGDADVADVVRLLTEHPDLLEINTDVRQKTAGERTRRAIIRCDGDETVGLGHVVRCLALAEEMRTAHSWGVTFAMAAGEAGFRMVTDAGFALEIMPEGEDEGAWVDGLIKKMSPDALIMDFRTDLRGSWVKGWREKGVLIVDIDDLGDRRLESDLAFYPPVPQVNEMDWQGFEGKLFSGWEWVILRRQFSDPPGRPASKPGDPPVILVTMGGSDPAGLTVRALRALDLVEEKFRVITVVGRGFSQRKDLAQVLREVNYPVEVLENVDDIDRKSTRLNSSHTDISRMPSSA